MDDKRFRALIVDDEALVRRMLTFALQKEGFACQVAADGDEAIAMPNVGHYDVVVIDLQMPHNGHALAVELLKLPQRPVLAIHTCVVEPLLIRDLVARGVDDFIFKPTNYAAFAAKMAGLVRRRRREQEEKLKPATQSTASREAKSASREPHSRLTRADVVAKLSSGGGSMSMSQTALDIYQLTLDAESETADIAEAIEREPSLTSEILRLGNSSHYNSGGKEISDLEKIVLRIGRRRIGELAIADNVCASLMDRLSPDMNVELAWRRSVAAGVAAQVLIDQGHQKQAGNGIVLAAVMHQLGRVLLAGAYPERYRETVDAAKHGQRAIGPLEQETFTAPQAELMADVLSAWNIPADVTGPLRDGERPFSKLAELAELVRKRAELLKTAILVGHLAAGEWEPWDLIDLPSARLVQRLQPASLQNVLKAAQEDLASVTARRVDAGANTAAELAPVRIGYVRPDGESFDMLSPLLRAAGLELLSKAPESHDCLVINGLDAGPEEAGSLSTSRGRQQTIAICDEASSRHFRSCDTVIKLPVCFAQLSLIRDLATASAPVAV